MLMLAQTGQPTKLELAVYEEVGKGALVDAEFHCIGPEALCIVAR